MNRRWKLVTGGGLALAGLGAYLHWIHDWRPSCRNVPSAAAAAEWLNGVTTEGAPYTAAYVACIELAVFYKSGGGPAGRRDIYPHPGIGVHLVAPPRAEDFAKLKDLPRLAELELLLTGSPPGYDDAAAAALSQLKPLRALAWRFGDGMTDAGARRLGDLANLEFLVLSKATLGSGLETWSKLTKLRRLHLRDPLLTADGVARLADLRAVDELWISFGRIDGPLGPIARMPALRTLRIFATKIDDEQIATLAGAPALAYLELNVEAIGPRGFAGLAKIENLAGMSLTADDYRGGIEQLAAARNLKRLALVAPNLDDARAAGVASARTLEGLSLSGTKIGDATAARLAALPNLEALDLEGTAITDEALRALAKAPRLKTLTVSQTAITDAGLVQLAAFPRLEEVKLYKTKATSAGIARLKGAKSGLTIRAE